MTDTVVSPCHGTRRRITSAEHARRVNAAARLLSAGLSVAEAARRLARRLEISERQARRCAEQARDSGPSQVPRPKARAPPRWLWWKLHGVTVRLHTPRSVRRLCAEAGVEVERLVSPDLSGPLRLPVVRGLATG